MTRRRVRMWATHSLSALGAGSLLAQSYQALWNRSVFPGHAFAVLCSAIAAALLYGSFLSRPPQPVRRFMRHPQCLIEIGAGDLFSDDNIHLVIGFSDTFDTDVTGDVIVSSTSIQGQFLDRVYAGNLERLDGHLESALGVQTHLEILSRNVKPYGKLVRYPIGTVATLGNSARRYFCVAYSRMGEDLVAQSSPDEIWLGLSGLWAATHRYGQRQKLTMPVVGAGLARVDTLDTASLLRLICMSFVAASKSRLLTAHLSIVLLESHFKALDRAELQAFLNSL